MLRLLTPYVLAGLIALCPVFCGVVDVVIGSHSHAGVDGPTVPDDCPEPSDNCVCHGAVVQPSPGIVSGHDRGVLGIFLDLFLHTPTHHLSHLTWNGSPGGLATFGDSLTVRSFLQNFRC